MRNFSLSKSNPKQEEGHTHSRRSVDISLKIEQLTSSKLIDKNNFKFAEEL
jgi:hypothetical protein